MGYSFSDNKGTFQGSVQKANAYWLVQRPQLPSLPPFALYMFSSPSSARDALLQLPFIHLTDSGALICDYVMEYGFYAISPEKPDSVWEAVVAGNDLTPELFDKTVAAFKSFGGTEKSVQRPEPAITPAKPANAGAPVIFREKFTKNQFTYETYDSASKAAATAFLAAHPVRERLYYICVYTPEGNFGRDIDGIYEM